MIAIVTLSNDTVLKNVAGNPNASRLNKAIIGKPGDGRMFRISYGYPFK